MLISKNIKQQTITYYLKGNFLYILVRNQLQAEIMFDWPIIAISFPGTLQITLLDNQFTISTLSIQIRPISLHKINEYLLSHQIKTKERKKLKGFINHHKELTIVGVNIQKERIKKLTVWEQSGLLLDQVISQYSGLVLILSLFKTSRYTQVNSNLLTNQLELLPGPVNQQFQQAKFMLIKHPFLLISKPRQLIVFNLENNSTIKKIDCQVKRMKEVQNRIFIDNNLWNFQLNVDNWVLNKRVKTFGEDVLQVQGQFLVQRNYLNLELHEKCEDGLRYIQTLVQNKETKIKSIKKTSFQSLQLIIQKQISQNKVQERFTFCDQQFLRKQFTNTIDINVFKSKCYKLNEEVFVFAGGFSPTVLPLQIGFQNSQFKIQQTTNPLFKKLTKSFLLAVKLQNVNNKEYLWQVTKQYIQLINSKKYYVKQLLGLDIFIDKCLILDNIMIISFHNQLHVYKYNINILTRLFIQCFDHQIQSIQPLNDFNMAIIQCYYQEQAHLIGIGIDVKKFVRMGQLDRIERIVSLNVTVNAVNYMINICKLVNHTQIVIANNQPVINKHKYPLQPLIIFKHDTDYLQNLVQLHGNVQKQFLSQKGCIISFPNSVVLQRVQDIPITVVNIIGMNNCQIYKAWKFGSYIVKIGKSIRLYQILSGRRTIKQEQVPGNFMYKQNKLYLNKKQQLKSYAYSKPIQQLDEYQGSIKFEQQISEIISIDQIFHLVVGVEYIWLVQFGYSEKRHVVWVVRKITFQNQHYEKFKNQIPIEQFNQLQLQTCLKSNKQILKVILVNKPKTLSKQVCQMCVLLQSNTLVWLQIANLIFRVCRRQSISFQISDIYEGQQNFIYARSHYLIFRISLLKFIANDQDESRFDFQKIGVMDEEISFLGIQKEITSIRLRGNKIEGKRSVIIKPHGQISITQFEKFEKKIITDIYI